MEETSNLHLTGAAPAPLEGKLAVPEPKKRHPSKGGLKEVIALLRPHKHIDTRKALEAAGVFSYTTQTVLGRSKQRGLRFQSEGEKEAVTIKFLPKRYFSIVVSENQVSNTVYAIMKANRTGTSGSVGDGRIFVIDIEDAVRISTDERGGEAI
jgi:nitrogen regulatory protein PII